MGIFSTEIIPLDHGARHTVTWSSYGSRADGISTIDEYHGGNDPTLLHRFLS
jgi:hypothetical protein